ESLFGMLTSAGVSLLPYFLLLRGFIEGDASKGGIAFDNTVGWLITILIFAATPLSSAQTEVSLANGSRWYYSETWPAALTGIAAEGAIIGLSYLTRGGGAGSVQPQLNPYVLLVGTIAFVPLIEMALINLVKSPRFAQPQKGSGGF